MGLFGRFSLYFRQSLHLRLTLLALTPILVFPFLAAVMLLLGNSYFERIMRHKAAADLAIAQEHLQFVQANVAVDVKSLADSSRIKRLLEGKATDVPLAEVLASRQENIGLDFLAVVDTDGRVIAAGDVLMRGAPYVDFAVMAKMRQEKKAISGIEVLSAKQLAQLAEADASDQYQCTEGFKSPAPRHLAPCQPRSVPATLRIFRLIFPIPRDRGLLVSRPRRRAPLQRDRRL